MEKLFDFSNGVPGVIASILVMLALNIIVKVGEFLWRLKEKRDAVTESGIAKLSTAVQLNTVASERLEIRIKHLEGTLSDVTKIKLDLRRLYTAVKTIAGEQWPEIRKEIMSEDEVSNIT